MPKNLTRQDYTAAFPQLVESFAILRDLQRADGMAVVGTALGELLTAAGRTDAAHQILNESLLAATRIGSTDLVEKINVLLVDLPDAGDEGA